MSVSIKSNNSTATIIGNRANVGVNTDTASVNIQGGSPTNKFIVLTDTPSSYTGQSGKLLSVKGTEDGLEYVDAPNSAVWGLITGTLTDQTDLQNALDTKVPYTGATADVDLGTHNLAVNKIELDTNPNLGTLTTGNLYWDTTNHTVSLTMQDTSVNLQLGQEVQIYVRNNSGATIPNGSIVYQTGVIGGHPTIDLAIATSENTTYPLAVATQDISNNDWGYCTTFGKVRDLNTQSFNENDEVYLSATTAGAYQTTPPASPNFVVKIGSVAVSNPANGELLVNIHNPLSNNNDLGNSQKMGATQNAIKNYIDTLIQSYFPPNNLLLDLYPDSAGAYSVRKLRTAYSGSAIRVKRSSDLAEQDIGFVDNELDVASLSSFVGYQNLMLQSEDFSATWSLATIGVSGITVTTNQTQNPFGTGTTADRLNIPAVPNPGNASIIWQPVTSTTTLLPNTQYTFSVYLRGSVGGEVTYIWWTNDSVTFQRTRCNLTTSWQRFSVTFTSASGTGLNALGIGTDRRDPSQVATSASTIFAWGAQVNIGTSPQNYQPTTTTTNTANGTVTTMYDQSGNNRNLTQGLLSAQPSIYSSGSIITRGGKPAIFMSNTSQRLTASTPNINYQNHFIATVIEFPSVTSDIDWYGTGTTLNGNILLMNFSGTTPPRAFRGHVFGTMTNSIDFQVATQPNTRYLFSQVQSVSNNIFATYRDGVQSTITRTANTVSGGNPTLLNLGGRTGGGSSSRYYQEVIVYSTDIYSNLGAIHSNINSYFSIY